MGKSDDDDDDNFVVIGTPLEPLEEDTVVRKKPVNIQDQVVVDENGRRRFHGAFTGGFSAGYYNTVGSKEGWTPSTFKSSRSGRSSAKSQNIHDFMDDEDVGSFGIAPQILRPTEEFTSTRKDNLKRPRPTPSDGPIPGAPILHQIIQPVVETIGVKVLRKMGWRPGEGVGPKALKSRKEKPKRKEFVEHDRDIIIEDHSDSGKFYGCSLPPKSTGSYDEGSGSSSEDDENLRPLLFAPKDTESPLCNPKVNTFGLGYKGLDRNTILSGHVDLFGPSLKFKVDNKKMNITGEAFGTGVFEDADEEVYSREDMTQYDFALETTQERKHRLLQEAKAKDKKKHKASHPGVISGFFKAKKSVLSQKYFPSPQLPSNFQPIHSQKKSRFGAQTKEQDESVQKKKLGLDRHQLSRDERQVLLGDAQPKKPNEVVTLIPSENNESIMDTSVPPPNISKSTPVESNKQDSLERIERLKKFADVLSAYSSRKPTGDISFKPFLRNPAKQERYEKFVTLRAAGYGECLKDLQPQEMTEWEREREKMEFERASALYKPMSGEMSSRFVSAKSHDISHIVPEREKELEKDPTQDPKVAAKMNLFGKLTHKIMEWHPDRIVCKRFNVPSPYPDSKFVGVISGPPEIRTVAKEVEVKKEPVAKKSLFEDLDFTKPPPGLLPVAPEIASLSSSVPSSTVEISQLDFDPTAVSDIPLPPERPKPPLDLFKEIFADTSSESEEDEEALSTTTTAVPITSKGSSGDRRDKSQEVVIKQEDRRTSKELSSQPKEKSRSRDDLPRVEEGQGIFRNLDFSKLTSTAPSPSTTSESSDRKQEVSSNPSRISFIPKRERESSAAAPKTSVLEFKDVDEDEELYGPAPPTNLQRKTLTGLPDPASNQSNREYDYYNSFRDTQLTAPSVSGKEEDKVIWVEKDAVGSSGKSRKKHSKKLKSHRHRSKSKKSKKHKSSSSKHKSKKHSRKTSKSHGKSGRRDESGSSSESDSNHSDDDDKNSSDQDDDVPIRNSQNSKALIAKLKELI